MFLHQSGNEYYCINGTALNAVFPLWDWDHVPGITVDYRARKLECSAWSSYRGKTNFVGGASDGTYGVFAMHFVAPIKINLSFQKAWFMFDNEIVVMGANITSLDRTTSVHHVLDSKVLNGPVRSSEGNHEPTGSTEMAMGISESKPWWLHHDSVGYVFPDNRDTRDGPSTLHLDTTRRSVGSWSSIGDGSEGVELPMFSAWLTGQGPPTINDSLVYVVVPAVTPAQFDPAATLAAIDVVTNTPHIQAVYHKRLRVLMAVFWSSTYRLTASKRGWRVSVDQPCVVLIRVIDKPRLLLLEITVSDPTQLLAGVSVTIDRAVECDACSRSSDRTSTTLTVSLADGASSSVSAVVLLEDGN
jgi:chondroitin AC lyase